MGGHGGDIASEHLEKLEQRAKEKLREADELSKKHIFMSFAYEDLDDVNMLRGQAKNEATDLDFADYSVKEPFDSDNAEYIRQGIRERIDKASVTLVYLSERSASSKWVNWEIEESIRLGKSVIGVHKGDAPPRRLPEAFMKYGCRAVKWTHEGIMKAIDECNEKK